MSTSDPQRPPIPEPLPRMAVRPVREGARDAFVRMISREHFAFIRRVCRLEGVIEESTKDVANRVLATAGRLFIEEELEEKGLPKNLRGWLFKIARNEARNHRAKWRPKAQEGADPDEAFSPAPDPEGTASLAERKAKLSRYLQRLPKHQAEVFLCYELYEMTIEQIAAALQRPEGTVAAHLHRARKKFDELRLESERATAAGERRR